MKNKFRFYDVIVYAARSSRSARRLATALGCRRWMDDLPTRYTRRRPYFRGTNSPMVIDWGSTRPADWLSDPRFRLKPVWINSPEACSRAIDKRAFFRAFKEGDSVPVLRATEDRNVAIGWLQKGFGVVARKTLTGSSGAGIVVVQPSDKAQKLPDAPLYTRYYPKTHEFRAHVFKGQLIDFTQKKRSSDAEANDSRIVRSHDNGWIHAHHALDLGRSDIELIGKASSDCLAKLGLDFGAVDILGVLESDSREGTTRPLKGFRICEVNTGPGLENTETIQAYAKAILKEREKINGISRH